MRRKYFGLAIAALATIGPMQAWGGDREIAEQIIQRLKTNRDSGALKDFTLDMKVDNGVVLFRGNVSQPSQKIVVLGAADGVLGITKIVDEVKVTSAAEAAPAKADKAAPVATETAVAIQQAAGQEEGEFSFRNALASQPIDVKAQRSGQIVPVSNLEPSNDAEVVAAVVSALSNAKESGQLRGFGVDVKSHNGILELSGRASSPAQRDAIIDIAENVPGVAGVREAIAIPTAAPNLPRLPEPPSLQDIGGGSLSPVAVDPVRNPGRRGTPATVASNPVAMPSMMAPYRMQNGAVSAVPASTGGMAPVAGQPVPMAPHSAVGAPRYDTPNMPNYAWPGYAAYPNYAAVTYPQQYSPTAWPYIGPFYPYPQVPLGWRRVSLEWDDGWWFLDFTDK